MLRFRGLIAGSLMLAALLLVGRLDTAHAEITVHLPASGGWQPTSGSEQGTGNNVFHDLQHGCGAAVTVSADGSLSGGCYYAIDADTSVIGTISGNIVLSDGSVTFHMESTEHREGEFPKTINITYDGTGSFNSGFPDHATGSANYSYTCAYDIPDSHCEPLDDSSQGTVDWTMNLFVPLPCSQDCPDLRVNRIDLVQAQTYNNSGTPAGDAALVAGKSTVARVFVAADKPCPTDVMPDQRCDVFLSGVTATLTAETSTGTPLAGEGVPINTGPVLAAGKAVLQLYTNGSVNFLLPNSWLGAGSLVLRTHIYPPPGVTESNPNNNEAATDATFSPSGRLEIDYIKVCYPDKDHCPTDRITTADSLLRKIAPVADDQYNYGPMPLPNIVYTKSLATYEDVAQFNAFLGKLYLIAALLDAQFFGSPPTMVYAWLPAEGSGGSYAILTDQQNHVWNGSGVGAWGTDSPYVPDFFLASGVGHNLGLGSAGGHVNCSDMSSDAQTHWPYQNVSSQEVGFDITTRSVVKPAENADLSSHCGANKTWVSPYTWEMMRKHIGSGTSSASAPVSASDNQLLVLSGTAKANGSGGTLDPLYQVTSSGPASVSDPNGTYCLSLQGGSGELSRFCFTPDFRSSDGTAITDSGFAFAVPMPAGTTKVLLVKGAQTLATQQASAHPPTIAITAPVAGDAWTGQQTITWTASDADSDPLTYTVTYSPDGKTWYPMAVDTTDKQFTFNTSDLTPGSSETFRVMASDGFNTTEATVGPLIVSQPSVKGDSDCSGAFAVLDVTATLGYLGGVGAPNCLASADINCDKAVTPAGRHLDAR